MFVNVIEAYRNVVAIADDDLIGRQFFEGKKQLDIKESFYKGESEGPVSKDEVLEIIGDMVREDATFNVVGEESIATAIEAGIINSESVLTIDGIPYGMVLL